MSSSPSSSPPAPSDPTTPRRRPVEAWHWPAGARLLLASQVSLVALGLWVASRDMPTTSGWVPARPELILDVNQAPVRALAALPQFGPTLASRLVKARAEGPFSSLEDLQDRVRGLGPVTLARISPYLRIEPTPGSGAKDSAGGRDEHPVAVARALRRKPPRARKPVAPPRTS